MSTEDHTVMPSGQPGPKAFMHGGRGRPGKPESSFFWLSVAGKACIAKALTTELGPHLRDFVDNEQQVLRLLRNKNAPVCKLVDYPDQPEWLVTEFGGLSLDLLGGRGNPDWPTLPIEEYVAVWAHFLYRAQSLDDLGAVPLDLAGRNLVVPIGTRGHLQLNEAISIDHAHTVVPSGRLPDGALKRPIWIDPQHNPHLAPELRGALQRDQLRLIQRLRELGVERPDCTMGLAQGPDGLPARTWFDYAEPQEIQGLVDRDEVGAGKVIQYAVGYDIHRRLHADHPLTPRLAYVVQRLCANDPAKRYKKLEHAADALKAALNGRLARASAYAYRPQLPQDLLPRPPREESLPLIKLSQFASAAGTDTFEPDNATEHGGTIEVGPDTDGAPAPFETEVEREDAISSPRLPPERHSPIQRWLWPLLAAALAVAIGIPLGTWLAAP